MARKPLLTLMLVMALGYAVNAQSLSFGPRIGATLTRQNYAGEGYDQFKKQLQMDSRMGLLLGVVTNISFSEAFSLQPELIFIQKGAKPTISGSSNSRRSDYLELPVLGKLSFGTGQVRGFLTAGPTAAYLLGGKEEYDYEGSHIEQRYHFVTDYFKRFEVGVSLGIGVGYKLGGHEVNLELRYAHGISKLFEEPVYHKARATNRGFNVSLAYLVPVR